VHLVLVSDNFWHFRSLLWQR